MATGTRTRKTSVSEQADVVPQTPQSTPPPNAGGGDYSPFVWQRLGDIQTVLGRLESNTTRLAADIQKLEHKLDETNTKLSGVMQKIYAAGVVLTILLALGGFIVNKSWDMMARSLIAQPAAAQPATPQGTSKP